MKVGVIGSGAISGIYLENMIHKYANLEVIAIADRSGIGSKKKAAEFGIEALTIESMLDRDDIEMIVNLTPVGAHYGIIKSALLAGKHVYTEKTLTSDLAQAKELLELAKERGLYLGSAPDTFLGSALQAARSAIDASLIGEINSFSISVNRNNSFLISLFPFLKEPGAGILLDYAVYHMTALVSLLGPVSRVGGIVRTPYKTHLNISPTSKEYGQVMETPNESQVSAIVQMKNGITGTLHIDAESNRNEETFFTLYGTKGILYLTDPNQFGGEVKYILDQSVLSNTSVPKTLWQFTPHRENSRGIGPSEMAEAILEKRPNRASKEMAFHVLEVLSSILKCGEQGNFFDIKSSFIQPAPLQPQKLNIKNIGHIALKMKHSKEMLAFYSEVLGMQKLFTLTTKMFNPKASEAEDLPCIDYMKLAEHQFLELIYSDEEPLETAADRRAHYGFMKVNFEVESIESIKKKLINAGVVLHEDIHTVVDGSQELTVFDPDGNEVQFTEYAKGELAKIKLSSTGHHETCSHVAYTTQIAYQVKDDVNMLNFYVKGLGFKRAMTLTFDDLYKALEADMEANPKELSEIEMIRDSPWIDFIEVAPHQYIEFFHSPNEIKKQAYHYENYYGYQHLCLEVEDIHLALEAITQNGIKPDTEISLGVDGAYQFWLTDPDGNPVEIMAYSESAKQLSVESDYL
ncbi:VOC family protein [Fusibacter bizertensis]|uniref:VOC family protein n=1 Tax=Fusibacter bizertensis TaxID=1488331 RepID=A0ABT6NE47_9FIRM|nr:VOC family protein [Fusibacter bizertensis]MDH8678677.1 VOC family protein [Fusibacter bizertensis]